MNVSAISHRLGQVERDMRRKRLEPEPADDEAAERRASLTVATKEELRELLAAVRADDQAAVERISDVLKQRLKARQRPPTSPVRVVELRRGNFYGCPPSLAEIAEDEAKLRAEGYRLLHAGGDQFVLVAFDPFAPPEGLAERSAPKPTEPEAQASASPPADEPEPEPAAEVSPLVQEQKPEPTPDSDNPRVWRSQRSRHPLDDVFGSMF